MRPTKLSFGQTSRVSLDGASWVEPPWHENCTLQPNPSYGRREITMSSEPETGKDHVLQFYMGEESALRQIAGFLSEGLRVGEAVVCIAREELHGPLREQLISEHPDLRNREAEGQILFIGSRRAKAQVVHDGTVNKAAFQELVGQVIEGLGSRFPRIRIHGDIVDILAQEGDLKAAAALESLWNEVLRCQSFPLF